MTPAPVQARCDGCDVYSLSRNPLTLPFPKTGERGNGIGSEAWTGRASPAGEVRRGGDRRDEVRGQVIKGSRNGTMPKNLNNEEIEDVPVVEDVLLDTAAELVELPVAPVAVVGPVAGKRALGVKEPIIFKWKLVGTSQNMTLTLFKSVEREEAEAQLERLGKEGYYTDLKILDAEAKVEQPARLKGTKKPTPRTERGGKAAVPAPARADGAKRSSTPAAPPQRRPAATRSALKTEVRPTKKKPTTSAAGSKRTAKKK